MATIYTPPALEFKKRVSIFERLQRKTNTNKESGKLQDGSCYVELNKNIRIGLKD